MPGFRVSKPAKADLRPIARHTQKKWGAEQRRVYLDGLNDKFETLSQNPTIAAEKAGF